MEELVLSLALSLSLSHSLTPPLSQLTSHEAVRAAPSIRCKSGEAKGSYTICPIREKNMRRSPTPAGTSTFSSKTTVRAAKRTSLRRTNVQEKKMRWGKEAHSKQRAVYQIASLLTCKSQQSPRHSSSACNSSKETLASALFFCREGSRDLTRADNLILAECHRHTRRMLAIRP